MKTLYFLRHAKALGAVPPKPLEGGSVVKLEVREQFNQNDKKRGLHADATHQVANLASTLQKEDSFYPDVLYYSNATRCLQTLSLMQQYNLCDDVVLREEEGLYNADATDVLEFLQLQDDAHASIALLGHNPAMMQLALALTGNGDVDDLVHLTKDLPTMGYVELCFDAKSWQDISLLSGQLEQFIAPSVKPMAYATAFSSGTGHQLRAAFQ